MGVTDSRRSESRSKRLPPGSMHLRTGGSHRAPSGRAAIRVIPLITWITSTLTFACGVSVGGANRASSGGASGMGGAVSGMGGVGGAHENSGGAATGGTPPSAGGNTLTGGTSANAGSA